MYDVVQDIIDIFEVNRKECVKILKELRYFFAPGTFASEDSPVKESQDKIVGDGDDESGDKIKAEVKEDMEGTEIKKEKENELESENTEGNERETKCVPGFGLEQVLVEAIFGQMFSLPHPKYKIIYYHSLFTELCKLLPDTFPPALGKAIRILFDRLDMMDVECVYRYWNWFSHHLSNFNFVWKWNEWEDCIREDPLHPKLCFIRETFEKLIRYSYYDRIKSNVSEEFLVVFPAAEPTTNFRYGSDDNQYHTLAQQVLGKLRSKSSNDQIQSLLSEVRNIIPDSPEAEQDNVMRDILVQCVLMLGSKSFSHVLNVIERYLTLLQSYNTTAEARVHTVKIVADFWSKNTQFLGILLDKLLNYRVVDASSVVMWIFSEGFDKEVSRSYIWEILKNTINKVISRVSQIQAKLDSLRKTAEEQGGDMTSDDRQSAVGSETESIQQIENTLSMVTREQKELLLLVFQKFADVLSKQLLEYRQQGIDDPLTQWWFYWVWGFFRDIARVYYSQLSSFIVTLETIVLTPGVDPIIENTVKLVRAFGYVTGQLEI